MINPEKIIRSGVIMLDPLIYVVRILCLAYLGWNAHKVYLILYPDPAPTQQVRYLYYHNQVPIDSAEYVRINQRNRSLELIGLAEVITDRTQQVPVVE